MKEKKFLKKKFKLGKKSTKLCPECGGVTVIEEEEDVFKNKHLIRRCDNLIENEYGNE